MCKCRRGGVLDLTQFNTGTTVQQFPATIGKHYLVTYGHGGGGGNVSSGATVESYFQYQNQVYIYLAVVVATATTVVMTGAGNYINYLQLD